MRAQPNKAKIGKAVEHILWCVSWQDDGFIPIRILRDSKSHHLAVIKTRWFSNRELNLEKKLTAFLKRYADQIVTVLYSPVAFSEKQAKAAYAVNSRIAYVDADGARLSIGIPDPTRTISSSDINEHWFWVLSNAVAPKELQAINRALTRLVHGDKGGHSPAKLFRIPGFPNLKYDRPFRVRLKEDTGEVHEVENMQALIPAPSDSSSSPKVNTRKTDSATKRQYPDRIVRRYNKKLHPNTRTRLRQRRIYGPFSCSYRGREYSNYPGDDRSEIVWGIALDLRHAGATPAEVLVVITNTIFWKAREIDGKAENPERLIERIFDAELDNEGEYEVKPAHRFNSVIKAIDPAEWDGLPVPVRQWIIENWIPLLKTTIIFGDGGTGKTLLMIMLAVACAMGFDFLGQTVTQGRVFALLGENDDDDTHSTMVDVCRHYGIELADLKGKARIASRAGFDNILMHFDKGTGKHTDLFHHLIAEASAFDADLIIIETASDLFGGNENVRNEVRQFVALCCEQLARAANAAVVLCAHPSVSGMRSGEGTSGSTAWGNSARSRLYLHRDIDDAGFEYDPDHRILSRKKSNFARQGETIDLYWQDGVFVTDDHALKRKSTSDIDKKIKDEIERAFEVGEPWGAHHQSGHRYFVNWIINNLKQSKAAAKAKLNRLLTDKEILEVNYDAHNHKKGLCTPEQAAKLMRNKNAK